SSKPASAGQRGVSVLNRWRLENCISFESLLTGRDVLHLPETLGAKIPPSARYGRRFGDWRRRFYRSQNVPVTLSKMRRLVIP
ncbi:hypothetical protein RCH09_003894, partial [Actimicrobium sp. GrIS 1.19]|uniref:hypothetical protein n=1 Tax=Actimicrobium sp. GrIS 1.19 TaxID=3071708 RepID=UPI002E0401B9|nr:hypothetical protein [Actimicrobium sp. GrIS 1.19]